MTDMLPLVSVVTPAYNSRHWLDSVIACVEAQTYPNIELIIIDDGSTDSTQDWANENQAKCRYFRQENQGPALARNFGVAQAKGKYIAFLDADDAWFPEKLSRQIAELENDSGAAFVFCNGHRVTSQALFPEICTQAKNSPKLSDLYTRPPLSLDFTFEFKIHCVATSSLVASRAKIIEVGGMPELRQGEDFVLVCRLLLHGNAIYIDDPLTIYRSHNANSSAKVAGRRNAIKKILATDIARLSIPSPNDTISKYPRVFGNYQRTPLIFRLFLLLYWRILLGNSKKKIGSDIVRYLKG